MCEFCPENWHSDGTGACEECGVSTAPETGIVYKWWNRLPIDSNITSSCLSSDGALCVRTQTHNTHAHMRAHIQSSSTRPTPDLGK